MTDTLVNLSNVTIGYHRPLLPPLRFQLKRGEFWGVVGPNGAGKTTLAKTLVGLLPPLTGEVIRPTRTVRFSYTPQRHRLNPSYPLTALDVVLMANAASLPLGHTPSRTDRLRAEEALNRFDSSVIANQLFRSLSGGQQQRVLLARAISTDPDVLVLDEPAEGMDLLGTHDTLDILKGVTTTQRMSVLMISHRLDDVIGSVDHLCLINQYNGLFESGPVEVMSDSSKLTSLFGRTVETHNCAGKKHVHVVGV